MFLTKYLKGSKSIFFFMFILLCQLASAQLVITEFMASNNETIADIDGDYSDWIEIHNEGGAAVNLSGYYLTDDSSDLTKWAFPSQNINAGAYLLIYASDKNLAVAGQQLHTNFKLSADGEYLAITNGTTAVDDYAPAFPTQYEDVSYGIYSGTEYYFSLPTPGSINNAPGSLDKVDAVDFSTQRGFYTAATAFDLTLSSATSLTETGVNIRYTLDGSEPSSTVGTLYSGVIAINATKTIRAIAYKTGWMDSKIKTHTYIFVADVKTQSSTGARPSTDWPDPTQSGQWIDYGMDPDVVNDPTYTDDVETALTQIPTISLVTDLDNLFDPTIGIYVNAFQHGIDWERPVSAELINPDGSEGFQINAGLRIRGGWSRHEDNPKHALRLFFRDEYGEATLKYPLFGDAAAVDEFKKIDLACSQNYSWAYKGEGGGFDNSNRNTFIRDLFSRDTQLAMGQPATRSNYYHVYINGQYWGLYYTQERPEQEYAEDYFGGDEDDYDVVKTVGWPEDGHPAEATAGTLDEYNALWNLARYTGFSSNAVYFEARGLNTDGTRNPAYTKKIDIENLIDYMLIVYYVGDFDGPISWFGGDNMANNYYGIYNKVNPDGWKFFRHDAEHSMFAYASDITQSIDRTGPYSAGNDMEDFNPQWLHQKLTDNTEYKLAFADRVNKRFFNGGVLSTEVAPTFVENRRDQIDMAIIAESARWGDMRVSPPQTKAVWETEVNTLLNDFFPTRTSTVLAQFRARGWYPTLDAPTFNQFGGRVTIGFPLTISAGTTTIYYTTDGSDPRLIGGNVNPTAVSTASGAMHNLTDSVTVKSRVRNGSNWSALTEAVFVVNEPSSPSNLAITEISYNPKDPTAAETASGPFTTITETTTIFPRNSTWKYLDNGSNQGTTWREIVFDDSTWASGPAELGNGDGGEATPINLGPSGTRYATTYFRTTFNVTNISDITSLNVKVMRDDGAIVFLNGQEVVRENIADGTTVNYDYYTNDPVGGSDESTFYDNPIDTTYLQEGTNTLAVEIHQSSGASNDLSFDLEIDAVKTSTVSTLGKDDFEFIELKNIGSQKIDFHGVSFTSGITYTCLTPETLNAGEYGVLVENIDAFEARYGSSIKILGEYKGNLDNGGEKLTMLDENGVDLLSFSYSDARGWPLAADGAGHSLVVKDASIAHEDDEYLDYGGNWKASVYINGSPGSAEPIIADSVVINEVMAHTDVVDPEYDSNDWIELYNPTGASVNISGWYLSDDADDLKKWAIPATTSVGASGFISFDEMNDFHNPIESGFGLNKEGENVFLSYLPGTSSDRVVDCVEFEGEENSISLGRYPDGGDYWYHMTSTRDDNNNAGNQSIVITEFMFHPLAADPLWDDSELEYVELYNPTSSTINLWNSAGEWRLSGGIDYTFPPSTSIAAHAKLVVLNFDPAVTASMDNFQTNYHLDDPLSSTSPGPYGGSLSNQGDKIALEKPQEPDVDGDNVSWVIVDEVIYFDRYPWTVNADGTGYSLNRISNSASGNDYSNWFANIATPADAPMATPTSSPLPTPTPTTVPTPTGVPTPTETPVPVSINYWKAY